MGELHGALIQTNCGTVSPFLHGSGPTCADVSETPYEGLLVQGSGFCSKEKWILLTVKHQNQERHQKN